MNYQKIYNEIIQKAKSRGLNKKFIEGYFEKHHIIPKCLGGSNDTNNLVLLTAKEHFICHHLLWRENKNNLKLFWAFKAMAFWKSAHTNKRDNLMLTSKQYEELRKKHNINVSIRMKGRSVSSETKQRIRESLLGTKLSDETKQKISIAHKQIIHTDKWNKKVGESLKGYKHSNDHINKNRIAHTGKKYSDETNSKKGSKGGKNPSAVKCSINGIEFDTLDAAIKYAMKEYNISLKQAYNKFLDPNEMDFVKHKNIIMPNSQKVSIDGTVFDSKTKAYFYAKNKYGIGNSKMMNRINSDEFPNWFVVKY